MFDSNCDMCLDSNEMLCKQGRVVGLITKGGFAEYISLPERMYSKYLI
jgi:D-arabinose 1-dehydrogenase-like Zn-dependent alcohol dehydrogenase